MHAMIDAAPGLQKLMSGGGGGDSVTFFSLPQNCLVNFQARSTGIYRTSPTSLTSNKPPKKGLRMQGGG